MNLKQQKLEQKKASEIGGDTRAWNSFYMRQDTVWLSSSLDTDLLIFICANSTCCLFVFVETNCNDHMILMSNMFFAIPL
jgi:hypothetical protein